MPNQSINEQSFLLHINCFWHSIFSSKKNYFLDRNSMEPIENVNIFNASTNQGTFTNVDGKVNLTTEGVIYKVSHINYKDTTITLTGDLALNTILLSPKVIELRSVEISSFDLKKSILNVLNNYDKLYLDVPTEKKCTFKESFLVDNQYKRLILSQINWWSKGSSHQYKDNYASFAKLQLQNIDFYRNEPMNILENSEKNDTSSKSSSVQPKTLINNIYLNYVLRILLAYPALESTVEDSPDNQIIVSFETDWKQSNTISSRASGLIIFDKLTRAIIQYNCDIEFKGNINETKDKNGRTYSYEQKKSIANYTFAKSINDKLSLKNCELHAEGVLSYQNKAFNFTFKNSLYVLKEFESKKIGDSGLIDLDKGIYESFPDTIIKNSNPIILSQAEQNFINK